MTLVAGGGLDKWFLCSLQSSIPTSKTDAIQSIHYQSTADAIRVSQQPLNVYQGQLRPIKPIRHHNVGRHSDEGRALNEASLKRSGKWSCGHWAVSLSVLQSTSRKSPLCLISVSFILFTHLHPTYLCTGSRLVCRHTLVIMLHVQANCAAKRIISVHCRQPVNQSSLCFCPPCPCCLFPSTYLQCAFRAGSYTRPDSSSDVWPSRPRCPEAYSSQPGRQWDILGWNAD